jgi:hypothetical protein
MPKPPLSFDENQHHILLCPVCDGDYVHIDDVYVAGRPREDGELVPVSVDHRGQVREGTQAALQIPDAGRRHAFSLRGWCEICGGQFALEFKQHKGQTVVRAVVPNWTEISR